MAATGTYLLQLAEASSSSVLSWAQEGYAVIYLSGMPHLHGKRLGVRKAMNGAMILSPASSWNIVTRRFLRRRGGWRRSAAAGARLRRRFGTGASGGPLRRHRNRHRRGGIWGYACADHRADGADDAGRGRHRGDEHTSFRRGEPSWRCRRLLFSPVCCRSLSGCSGSAPTSATFPTPSSPGS